MPATIRLPACRMALILLAALTASAAAAAEKVAVFPVELFDPGAAYGSRVRPVDARKLALVTDELKASLGKQDGLVLLDTAPASAEVEKQGPLFKCNGCAADIAKGLGADLVVTGYAERGANQIFNLSATIVEVGTGKVIRGGLVTIRADDDNTWAHAMRWLVRNRLLAEPLPGKT